ERTADDLHTRTHNPLAPSAAPHQELVHQLDPALPVEDMRTLAAQVELSLANDRLIANLSAMFGLLATLLAMIGLYGVMTYSVARRTREIGVRIALGAVSRDVSWLILREVGTLVLIGSVIALPVIWGL